MMLIVPPVQRRVQNAGAVLTGRAAQQVAATNRKSVSTHQCSVLTYSDISVLKSEHVHGIVHHCIRVSGPWNRHPAGRGDGRHDCRWPCPQRLYATDVGDRHHLLLRLWRRSVLLSDGEEARTGSAGKTTGVATAGGAGTPFPGQVPYHCRAWLSLHLRHADHHPHCHRRKRLQHPSLRAPESLQHPSLGIGRRLLRLLFQSFP